MSKNIIYNLNIQMFYYLYNSNYECIKQESARLADALYAALSGRNIYLNKFL